MTAMQDRLIETEAPEAERLSAVQHAVREARSTLDHVIDTAMQALENARAALESAEMPNLLLAVRHEHDRVHDGGFAVCANELCRFAVSLG